MVSNKHGVKMCVKSASVINVSKYSSRIVVKMKFLLDYEWPFNLGNIYFP